MHEIGPDQPGKFERAVDDALSGLCHSQQKKGDQSDSDLNAYGVFTNADEALDSEGLLDPTKEQLNLPALFIQVGNLLGWCI